jgi:hypothetical protein
MCTYTSRNTNICISGLNFGNDIFLRTHYLWWSMTTKNIFTRQIDRAHFSFFPLFLWRLPHFRGFCNFLTKTVKRSECASSFLQARPTFSKLILSVLQGSKCSLCHFSPSPHTSSSIITSTTQFSSHQLAPHWCVSQILSLVTAIMLKK